jgi:hypothetical protein
MGVGYWSEPTRNLIKKEADLGSFDAIVHLGDIGYDLDGKGGSVGNKYGRLIQEFAAIKPYMTLPGNHEKASNFTHYTNRYIMPENWLPEIHRFTIASTWAELTSYVIIARFSFMDKLKSKISC